MSRTTAPLSDAACRLAKPTDRAYKLFEGDGLYLLVQPNGRKGWRLRYVKPDGREGLTSFGNYPVIGLADARRKRFEVKRMLADGVDPIETKHQAKAEAVIKGRTFESARSSYLSDPFVHAGPSKQGCKAALFGWTSLKKSKAHATICGKLLISTGG
ncbi:hypothetical protein ALP01_200491 [Pseudomonas caricapapayae]|nr:hypothetical protein ALP01_200491 [Pseudomonas caricapapayae]